METKALFHVPFRAQRYPRDLLRNTPNMKACLYNASGANPALSFDQINYEAEHQAGDYTLMTTSLIKRQTSQTENQSLPPTSNHHPIQTKAQLEHVNIRGPVAPNLETPINITRKKKPRFSRKRGHSLFPPKRGNIKAQIISAGSLSEKAKRRQDSKQS